MKHLMLFLTLLWTFSAWAAPYAVVKVGPGVTSCGVTLDAAAKITVPVTLAVPPATQNACYPDLAAVTVGSHSLVSTAIQTDAKWGTLESGASAPFVFVRPGVPAVPSIDPNIVTTIP